MIKGLIWKGLGVLLIIYSLIAGLLIPLGQGVESVEPRTGRLGEIFTLDVLGYNTQYTQNQSGIRAWLKLDSIHAIAAESIEVLNDRSLRATFQVPEAIHFKANRYLTTLIIDEQDHGTAIYPSAVIFTPSESGYVQGEWPRGLIHNLNNATSMHFPYRTILFETIRNTYYHVPMWFALLFVMLVAAVRAGMFLASGQMVHDEWSYGLTLVGTVLGVLGLLTGAIWANYTWGAPWSWDIKQNMSLIAVMMYGAYFLIRNSIQDVDRKCRSAAIYNIVNFTLLIPLLYIIPRLVDSLHPGSGGNPAMGGEDLDNTMRMVFYPAIIGWILFSFWIAQIVARLRKIERLRLEDDSNY